MVSPRIAQANVCYKFTVYSQQTLKSPSDNSGGNKANTRLITNSPYGQLLVEAQPLTVAADPTSTMVGTVYGTASQPLTNGSDYQGTDIFFQVLDFHVDGTLAVTNALTGVVAANKYVNGTFVSVGAVDDFSAVCTVPVLGGTGDFELVTRGKIVETYAIGNATTLNTTLKNDVTICVDLI
jgi:hypothetical protein